MKIRLLLLCLHIAILSQAVSFTWNGAGADNNMMTAANWVGGVAPSGNANEDLIFGGTVRTSPVNDFPNGTSFKSISLVGAFGSSSSFSISGNDILLTGGSPAVLNNSGTAGVGGYSLTITANIKFASAAPTISNALTSNSSINLNGLIDNNGLNITVNNIGPTTNVFLNGNIIGTGGLTLNGPGLVWIGGTNSFTGGTILNAGGIKINNAQAFGPINSSITINGGVLDAVTTNRNLINYTWTANASFGFLGTRNLNIGSGTFTLANNITIDVQKNTLSIPAVASGNFSINQTSSVTPASATMFIAGNNSFNGRYTVSAGTLRLGSGTAMGTTGNGVLVVPGATLDLNGQNYTSNEPLTIGGFGISNGAIVNSNAAAATYAGLLTLSSASSIIASVGDITFSNPGNVTGAYPLTVGGVANMNIASNLSMGSGTLTKIDNSTLTLSGNSTFSGPTTVSAGRLHVTGSSINSTVTINAGATLSGIGTVSAFVTNGIVQPGSPTTVGILSGNSSADFSGAGTPTLNVRVKGFAVPGTDYDRLNISGALALGGSSVLNLDLSGITTTGTVFGIVQMGSRTGSFSTVNVTNSGQYNVCVVYNATRVDVIVSLGFLWLKANANVTGTAVVTAWGDQSCNGFGVAQGTAANSPSLVENDFNFNPGVKFDGTNDYMTRASGLFSNKTYSNLYTYAVFRTDVQKDQSLFWESLSGGWNTDRFNLHNPWSDNSIYYDVGNVLSGNRVSGAWGGTYGKYNVWALQSSTSTSTPSGQNKAIYRDGKSLFTSAGSIAYTGANQPFDLGRQEPIASNYFNGSLAELIVFNTPFTTNLHRAFQSYLAIKYGITLDQTSLQDYYASDGTTIIYPTNSDVTYNTYTFGIAGIGRDDFLYQNQKQSKSYNTNDIVTGALGAVATTNSANVNSFSADKSFLVWGNDNGALMAKGQTDFNSAVLQGRIWRVWHVKETGTVNTVRIQADFSSFYGPGGVTGTNDLANTRLLVDADGVFAVGATAISPTSYNNGTGLAQFDVDFTTTIGYYFTFGTTDIVNTPLPTHRFTLDAFKQNEYVKVVWQTEAKQIHHFAIFHSTNNKVWEQLATINSTSQSENLPFEYLDAESRKGIHYYKVIQYLNDGTDFELGVRKINLTNEATFDWNIYPNPNSGHFQVNILGELDETTTIELFDLSGKSVKVLPVISNSTEIKLDDIGKGIYVAKISKEGFVGVQRIVIQ